MTDIEIRAIRHALALIGKAKDHYGLGIYRPNDEKLATALQGQTTLLVDAASWLSALLPK